MTATSWGADPYADIPWPDEPPDYSEPEHPPPPADFEPATEAAIIPIDRAQRDTRPAPPRAVRLMLPPPETPMPVARELIRRLWTDEQGRALIGRWRDGWVAYAGTHWEHVSESEVRAQLYLALEHARVQPAEGKGTAEAWNPTSTRVNKVIDALSAAAHIHDDREEDRGEYIALANGLLDLRTRELTPHTPVWFSFTCLPYAYDPLASPPGALLRFAESVWGDDQESVDLLQEWLGYVVSGSISKQKILLLVGAKRAGKGTIIKLLRGLVGMRNCTPFTMTALGRQFGISNAIGKTLGVVADARVEGRPPAELIERLLMISAGDPIDVDIKKRDPWHGVLPLRLALASNEIPRLHDNSGALTSRFSVLYFEKSMLGREDEQLDARLAAEMPAIFLWALAGMDRLATRGRFTRTDREVEELELMEDLGSPAAAFIRDRCEVGPEHHVSKELLFAAWKAWCAEQGHEAGALRTFTRSLKAVIPALKTRDRGTGEDRGQRPYFGIALRVQPGTRPGTEAVTVGRWRSGEAVQVDRCAQCGDLLGGGEHDCPYALPV